MGFDFSIQLILKICSKTGQPFFYSNKFEKIYELPKLEVPEEFRPFVQDRGRLYHVYTDDFNIDNKLEASPEELLDVFPDWEDVKGSDYYEGYTENDWSEKTHNLFREALEWFAKQPYSFQASWSY